MPFKAASTPRDRVLISTSWSQSGPAPPRVENPDRLWTKGYHDHAVDRVEVEGRARRLLPHADVRLTDLDASARVDHEALSSLGKVTYLVPDEYATFYQTVNSVFPERVFAPGTVGAYTGCAGAQTVHDACALPCVSGLPRPGVPSCELSVLWATALNPARPEELTYQRLYRPENGGQGRAVLYVPHNVPWRGLSRTLASGMGQTMGIQTARIVRYDPVAGARVDETPAALANVIEGFVPLDTLVAAETACPDAAVAVARPTAVAARPSAVGSAAKLAVLYGSFQAGRAAQAVQSRRWVQALILILVVLAIVGLIVWISRRNKKAAY